MKEISYEDALKLIESLIQEMENGKLPLEETIEKYKEGIKLVKFCQSKLNEFEKTITQITEEDGKIYEEDITDEF